VPGHAELFLQIIGQPEQIKPPDTVGQKFPPEKGPRLPVIEQLPPRNPGLVTAVLDYAGIVIHVDVIVFGPGEPFAFTRRRVEPEPENQPEKTGGTGEDEGHFPALLIAEMDEAPRHEQRADHRATICAAVENAGGERAFALGKPFGDGLDGGGKISGLADAEQAAHDHVHPRQAADEGIGDSKHRPDDERQGEAELGADLVNDPAGENGHARVKRREGGGQIRKIGVAPAEPARRRRRAEKLLEITDDLPVHVVDRRGKKQQRADDPAEIAGLGLRLHKPIPAAGLLNVPGCWNAAWWTWIYLG